MKFINALNFLNLVAAEDKFKSVPLAVSTPEKLSELLDKINQPEIEEKPAINIRRLGRAVTSFIGYELDTKV